MNVPKGFHFFSANSGIKDKTLDFALVFCKKKCSSAALFTKNNFVGSPISVGKQHIQNGILQAICVNSKNANVFTGKQGIEDCLKICKKVAKELNINYQDVLPSSTGVIGVSLPVQKILNVCVNIKEKSNSANWLGFAKAIMTTDTKPKYSIKTFSTETGQASILGIAKGSGMIEPNMATMLCYIFTDAEFEGDLYHILKKSCDKSFNCITIDSDTSTSDTVTLMSSGLSGKVNQENFQEILDELCIDLAKQIVRDGEGVSKLIELKIKNAKNVAQAKKIGKSILNSPLVKTAIYGGEPNWGRMIMAIGKVFDEPIDEKNIQIAFGDCLLLKEQEVIGDLSEISYYLKNNTDIKITIHLNQGSVHSTFWGSDLTERYVKENAYYIS